MTGALTPPPWTEDALCTQTDPEAFFPEKGGSPRKAQKVCQRCPAIEPCLQWALDNHELFGVWGGTSESDRRKIRAGHGDDPPGTCEKCGQREAWAPKAHYCADCLAENRRETHRRSDGRRRAA